MPSAECREFPVFLPCSSFGAIAPPLYRANEMLLEGANARRATKPTFRSYQCGLTAESAAQPLHFRCTRDSHDVTRIYNVSNDSLAPVRRDAMKAPD
jgi:hypothetical protein